MLVGSESRTKRKFGTGRFTRDSDGDAGRGLVAQLQIKTFWGS